VERVAVAVAEARAAGLEVRAEADRLVVRGPRVHERKAHHLLEQKSAVLALLAQQDAEVAWRVAAMRPQVAAKGPIPILIARDTSPKVGCCISCGDPLAENSKYRCTWCARAAWLVLGEVREGVTQEP
jgi:hypothetical protein